MASERGKAWLVVAWTDGCGACRDEDLLNFILEVSRSGIENSISGNGMIIVEVVVWLLLAACLCMWKRFIVLRWMPFFLEVYYSHDVMHASKRMGIFYQV